MKQLILQIILRQWDKSQRSEQDTQARNALSNCYPVIIPPAKTLFDDQVIIDQHGDNLLANRLQYQLLDNDLLIDRFRFNLTARTVEFKTKLTAEAAPVQLTKLTDGWQQFQYHWRYRVEYNEQIFWLYETVILNAACSEDYDETVFVKSSPINQFNNLLN